MKHIILESKSKIGNSISSSKLLFSLLDLIIVWDIERLRSTTCTWTSTRTSNFPRITSSLLSGHMVYVNCTSCTIRVGRRLQVSTYVWYFHIYLNILHFHKINHDGICIFLYSEILCFLRSNWDQRWCKDCIVLVELEKEERRQRLPDA